MTIKGNVMPFMEQEMTEKQLWFMVDGNYSTDYVPVWVTNYPRAHKLTPGQEVTPSLSHLFSLICGYVWEYTDNTTITSITVVEGYGARMTAPGYLDCTGWDVYDTVEDARAALEAEYEEAEEEA